MAETKEQSSPQSSPRTKLGNNNSSMSNNASSIHEDENLISHKGVIKTPSTVQESKFKPVTSLKEDRPKKYSLQYEGPLIFKPSLREKLSALLKSKTAEITITGLIAIYMILVFLNIMMETGVEEDLNLVRAIKGLKFAELGILALLITEVILKVAVFGIKGYFRNIWSIIDCMLLFVTFGMVIADIELEDSTFNGVNRVRALFRLFRVFLIIRKANDISRINIARVGTSNLAFKSPVEKVLGLFETFKRCISDKSLIQEIDWAIETVSSNKLYEPIIDEEKDGKNEVGLWVKSYQTKDKVDPKKISQELARRPSSLPPAGITPSSKATNIVLPFEAREMLTKNVDLLSFDVMEFKELSTGQELSYTAMFLFERHNFFDALHIKQQTFFKFIRKVQTGYLPNPYHNSTHAADVLQSTNYFLTTGEFISKAQLTNLEVCSLFIGSAIHDYDHPGTNNAFHINTSSPYAIRYNDRGVLENHHVSSVFELMKNEEFNIFADFSKEDYKIIRERVIAIVLATDMSTHFGDVAKLKGRLAADFDIKDKDKKFIMEMIVHAADISNPSKPWDTCKEWTTRIVTEFFNQGDKERDIGLPITYLCDRYTVNTAKSQIGFIDFVVSPLFTLMKEVLPKVDISHLEINKNKWKDLVEFYEQELKAVNERRKTTTEAKEIAA